MSEQATVISIGVMALGLLGFIAKLTFPYWMKTIDKKDAYIQEVTEKFRITVERIVESSNDSHNRLAAGIEAQNKATSAQTEVFKKLIGK